MKAVLIIGFLVIVLIILYMRNKSFFQLNAVNKGNLIVYGSKTCPWCVKQEDWLTKSGIDYNFVDCTQMECPDFVKGFPTLLLNKEVINGYTELGPDLTYPAPAKTQVPF